MGKNGEAFWRNLLPAKDLNDSSTLLDAEPVFIVVENIFCVYFVIELALRFGAFRYKRDCFKDAWFCFDSLLVALMVPWLGSSGMLLFFWNLQRHQHITILATLHCTTRSWIYPRYLRPGFLPLWSFLGGKTSGTNGTGLSQEWCCLGTSQILANMPK